MANIITWRVLPDTLGSDYFVILMSIDSPCQQNTDTIFPKTKWNTKKADWARYEILIDAYFSDGHRDFEDLNLKYNYFMSGIEAAASASIPTKKPFQPNNRRPSPPWWDSDCDYIVSQRKQALVNYSTQSTLENYIKVKKEMAASKKLLKKKAKNHWMQYCSKLNKNTPSRELWQQAKKMQRSIRNNTCQNLDWLDDFLNKIAPPSVSNNFEEETHYNQTNNDFFDTPITYEFNYILKNTSNTSPGYDQVTYDMLRNLPLSAKLYLIEIYNTLDLTGKYWSKKKSPPTCEAFRNVCHLLQILKNSNTPHLSEYLESVKPISIVIPKYKWNTAVDNSILNQYLSNYPEAIGISKAIEYIEHNSINNAVILSDSLSVLKSISHHIDINNPYNNPVIQQLKLQIHNLINRGLEVNFIWVKAHTGTHTNEMVDKLAKESIYTGLELGNKVGVQECISECKNKMKQIWNNDWNQYCTQTPTQYTLIQPTIPQELWYKHSKYSRRDIVTISRQKFGHACYPYHLNKIGIQNTNTCDICDTVSNLDHIFFECSKYTRETNQLYSNLIKHNILPPFSLVSLLAMKRTDIYDAILIFVKSCRLKL
nr:unnamed protein product [Callosobruchus analis]